MVVCIYVNDGNTCIVFFLESGLLESVLLFLEQNLAELFCLYTEYRGWHYQASQFRSVSFHPPSPNLNYTAAIHQSRCTHLQVAEISLSRKSTGICLSK